jgi:hypothetical protein
MVFYDSTAVALSFAIFHFVESRLSPVAHKIFLSPIANREEVGCFARKRKMRNIAPAAPATTGLRRL